MNHSEIVYKSGILEMFENINGIVFNNGNVCLWLSDPEGIKIFKLLSYEC